ncbi:MAG: hypothetical protein HC921_10610 [Synechococcaceae cyanobacterium SM2_3_1]|nr:hypothetical protein [Synechococcaceae cyanobacterium SM2_3_1]
MTFGLAVALSAGLAAGESILIQLTQGPLAWSFPFTPEAVGCTAGSTTCAVNLTLTLPASVTAGSYVLSAQITTLTQEVFTAGQPLVIVANAANVGASPTPVPSSTPTIAPSPGGSPTPTPAVSPLSSCREWILTSDFQAFPNQRNPNPDSCGAEGIWAFQRGPAESVDPAQFLLLSQFLPTTLGISGLETWQGTTPDPQEVTVNFPWVGLNTSREPQGSWPEGAIQVHPAPTEQVILRWRSPLQGTVLIEGSVSQPEQGGGDGVSWRIQQGSTILFAGAIPDLGSQSFSVRTATTLNESIYLIIDPNSSNLSDATQVELRIVQES